MASEVDKVRGIFDMDVSRFNIFRVIRGRADGETRS